MERASEKGGGGGEMRGREDVESEETGSHEAQRKQCGGCGVCV